MKPYSIVLALLIVFSIAIGNAQSSNQSGRDTTTTSFDSTYYPILEKMPVFTLSVGNPTNSWIQVAIGNDTTYNSGMVVVMPNSSLTKRMSTKSQLVVGQTYRYTRARFLSGAAGGYFTILILPTN